MYEHRSRYFDPLAAVVGLLAVVTWVVALVQVLFLIAGPFTWFLTWMLLLYALPYALALHGLTLLVGVAAALARPDEPLPQGTFALKAAALGLAPYGVGLVLFLAGLF